ncbi:diiron oxygenase [Nocardia farcinica]|uniref:p-aminobenzoate N-oxygenase AurF n=2 Tax=Nocardia farcinica TaxID=37329 RepID=Q5YWH8_NOCFA|nr:MULTISPECIES: diiron oxygenase [Nocardia]AXK84890.1 diiron oxygenase [Nocardia farcinica]MBA4854597.1 diiron oxygenase [Nocardia farcinica]MBC9814782.1 diiron oxygenase [Nocardia farcinica]MBF6067545.1 diiron oxygenase [Nocardia farcinica]MBF6141073.1 diiron oxygenase [Nocardia farcinica]
MTLSESVRAGLFDQEYRDALATLSDGSVHRKFDPYLDIDWDSPELGIDKNDPRWILSPDYDPLGATSWYRNLPVERQIEIGRWRTANAIKVGAAFESVLIRGMMQYIMKLPNQSPEFRYCLHEMTEECNHIQMFQELVNRIGDDVPGMRPIFRRLSPFIGVAGGFAPAILFIGILGGEEPIDHYQKALLRDGGNIPPAVRRCMQIHIAEEARHISFANEFLKAHLEHMTPAGRAVCAVAFPVVMRWLAGEIMVPPRSFAEKFDVPREVFKEAFWRAPHSKRILAGYFGDVRKLADELGLMNPVTKRLWALLNVDGEASRYRSEPERRAA